MAWYDRLIGRKVETEDKLNPAQPYYDHKTEPSREKVVNYERAYEDLEVVKDCIKSRNDKIIGYNSLEKPLKKVDKFSNES